MKSTFNFTTDPGSAPTPSALPLHALRPGDAGRVVDVDTSAPAGVRLLDLGFVPGTLVRVVRRAPLRDPVVYELRG